MNPKIRAGSGIILDESRSNEESPLVAQVPHGNKINVVEGYNADTLSGNPAFNQLKFD